jgi:hypothetical protein
LSQVTRRYRIRERWSDSRNGRLDGWRGIPKFPVAPSAESGQPETRAYESSARPRTRISRPPYLDGLRCACEQELAQEFGVHEANLMRLYQELVAARKNLEPLATDVELAESRFDKVADELTEDELSRRGRAEQDESKWPLDRLKERRRRERRIARFEAEEILSQATRKAQVAALDVEHAQKAYDECLKATQSRGWEIAHHYRRREAFYLRALRLAWASDERRRPSLAPGERSGDER